MSNKPKRIEECYSRKKNKIINIKDVADYAENHEGDLGEFYGDMFCEECKQAKLSFVHKFSKRRAHFRRASKHEKDCSYNYEYASKRTVTKYINSLNDEEIQDKLDSIMNMLCRNSNMKKTITGDAEENARKRENPMLISEQNKKKTILRALRRKNLNGRIDETDGTDLYVFFGEVKLEVLEKEKNSDDPKKCYTYNILNIYTQNKQDEWKFRTSLYRGKIKDPVKEDAVYHIVLIGQLEFKYKPFSIKLVNKNAIKYREL